MSGASAVSQTPARRAQPTSVLRQMGAPVQPGHALGAALVEGHSECLFAGLVTTALTGKIATPEIRRAKNSVPHRSIRNTTPRRTSRFGKPSAVTCRLQPRPSVFAFRHT